MAYTEDTLFASLCATVARGLTTPIYSCSRTRPRGTALSPLCQGARWGHLFGDADETPPQDRDRQEGHHALLASQDEGQAQKHGLSRSDIHGYLGAQCQYSCSKLWLGLCAGGHEGTYGKGMGLIADG